MSPAARALTAPRWVLPFGIGLAWAILVSVAGTVAGRTLHPTQTVKILLSLLVGLATIAVIYAGRRLLRRVGSET